MKVRVTGKTPSWTNRDCCGSSNIVYTVTLSINLREANIPRNATSLVSRL